MGCGNIRIEPRSSPLCAVLALLALVVSMGQWSGCPAGHDHSPIVPVSASLASADAGHDSTCRTASSDEPARTQSRHRNASSSQGSKHVPAPGAEVITTAGPPAPGYAVGASPASPAFSGRTLLIELGIARS